MNDTKERWRRRAPVIPSWAVMTTVLLLTDCKVLGECYKVHCFYGQGWVRRGEKEEEGEEEGEVLRL